MKIRQAFQILALAAVPLLPSCSSAKTAQQNNENENLIILYSPESGNEALLKAANKYGSEVLYVYKYINGIAVTVPKNKTVPDAIKYYEKVPGVLSVEKDRKMQLE